MIGTTLGPYRIDAELGSGGMGTVYRALGPDGAVALKVVHERVASAPGFLERFLREGEIGRRVRHDNVVATIGTGRDGDRHWIALEYVEGRTLRAVAAEIGTLPEELCRHVGREVARGLAALHAAGLVHRDVKPENVLITRDHVVKVMDLGIARGAGDEQRMTATGTFVGSVLYAAPEQFAGGGKGIDGRADLHALGATLYELATGVHPLEGEDVPSTLRNILDVTPRRAGEVNPQLSAFFEEILRTLLEKDRGRRFASAAELVEALERGEGGGWWHGRAKAIRAATRKPLRRIRIPRETALYGREADLAKLRAAFDAAKAGDGRVVLVEGEAGIGKSRLVDEFVGLLQGEGQDLDFLFGGYPPGGAATASGAFSTAYREHFGVEGLEDALRAALPHTPLLVPAFAALLRGDAAPPGAEALTKDSLQTVFVRATQSLAAVRPTIVLVEDLHFAPDEGRALFAALALALPGHRVLLVGTSRRGLDEKWLTSLARHSHSSRLALPRLSPADLVRLLRDALRSEHLAEELGGKIAAKSDGNPYFVFEILRGLREGQFLTQKPDGTWATTRLIAEIRIPPSIAELIQARIADVTDDDRNLLEAASCVGFEFDAAIAGAVAGLGPIPALQRFGSLEKRLRLVRSAGRRFVFDHHQVQETLYAGISEPLRERYHGAIGKALEADGGAAARDPKGLPGDLCVDLAEHFLKGGEGVRAERYLDRALTHLEEGYLNDALIRLADRALEVRGLLPERRRCELLLRKEVCLGLVGRVSEDRAAIDGVMAMADAGGWADLRALARHRLGLHLHDLSRNEEAVPVLTAAAELARSARNLEIEIDATNVLGLALESLGRYEEAGEIHSRQMAQTREAGDRRREAAATGNLGILCWARGRLEEALAHHERKLALCREVGYRRGVCEALANVAITLHDLGRFEEARARHEESLTEVRGIGHRLGEALGTGNLANLLVSLGRIADAIPLYERGLALARELGYRRGESVALANLASTLHLCGRLGPAEAHARRSLEVAREIRFPRGEGYALHGFGEIAEEAGDAGEGERLLGEALAMRRRGGEREGIAESLLALGALLDRAGRTTEARAALEETIAVGRETGAPGRVVLAACRLACLPGGDVAAARAALAEREARLEPRAKMEALFLLWRAAGDPAHLAEAKRLLDLLVAGAPEDFRPSMIANVRLHREIAESSRSAEA